MTAHGPHGDASTVCAQGMLAAKHKGKSGSSTQETPHVLVENRNKLRHTCYSAPNSHNFLPSPLSDLFIANNTQHSYYTRQHQDVCTNIGSNENVYRLFSFQGTHVWNHISKKYRLMYHILAIKDVKRLHLK